MFDPTADPLADPELAALVVTKLLKAADQPWEMEQPPEFDPLEAVERFLKLAREVEAIVGQACDVEMWPHVRSATFHGELVLPPGALGSDGYAVVRASNFAGLIAVLNDEEIVRPDVMAALRKRFERNHYKFIPSSRLRRAYDGHHRGTKQFATWADRLFGYV
jgi:hypothetical protein